MSVGAGTVTLTDFLNARIAEDERTDMGLHHSTACREFGGWPGDPESYVACDCGVSARVLAECEAKRRIIDLAYQNAVTIDSEWGCCHDAEEIRRGYRDAMGDWDEDEPLPDECRGSDEVVKSLAPLAAVYADHPDYQQEWKP